KMQVAPASAARVPITKAAVSENVLVALVGLGWSERVAAQAIEDALGGASVDESATVGSLLRLALANLGPQQVGAR
ncbi:MAG: holliday junction helicase RuvA, partial [Microbacteriaceae bacterium]|nr:holliday junction helicase RuvA [Microbacteriaceae bacterium]